MNNTNNTNDTNNTNNTNNGNNRGTGPADRGRSGSIRGSLTLLLCSIIWGSGFIGQKVGLSDLPPFALNGARHLLSAVILIPAGFFLMKKNGYTDKDKYGSDEVRRRWQNLIKGSLICGIFLALGTNMQQAGLMWISAGESGFITALYVIIVPFFGTFLGLKIKKRIWGCAAASIIGFGLLCLKDQMHISAGVWLTLGCAFAFSVEMLAIDRFVTPRNAVALSAGQMLVAALVSVAVSFFLESPSTGQLVSGLPVILYLALVPTTLGYTLQIIGQGHTEPALASLILSLESVFAAIFGVLFLGESMTARELAGCAIIFGSIVVAQLPDKRPDKRTDRKEGQ